MNKYCEVCECDPCDCDGKHDPLEGQDVKHEYIYDEKREFYYVPRAPSLCEDKGFNFFEAFWRHATYC